jgi:hypothetical protein
MLCVEHNLHVCVVLFHASFSADRPGTRMGFIIACRYCSYSVAILVLHLSCFGYVPFLDM